MKYEPIKNKIDTWISQSPWLKKIFFKLLDIYLLRTWHVHRLLKQIAKQKNSTLHILDAGCGFGQYSYYMSKLFKNSFLTGVDIQEAHILKASEFFKQTGLQDRTEFLTADLTTFKRPGQYDLILSVDVMEHILEDEKVFKNFFESLKDNGYLIVSTPSDQGGSDVHDHDSDSSFIDEHVRDGYGVDEMKQKLQNAGFDKIQIRYTYGKAGQLSWKLLMKIPITLLNKSKFFLLLLVIYWIPVVPFCLILNYFDTVSRNKTGTGLLVLAQKSTT